MGDQVVGGGGGWVVVGDGVEELERGSNLVAADPYGREFVGAVGAGGGRQAGVRALIREGHGCATNRSSRRIRHGAEDAAGVHLRAKRGRAAQQHDKAGQHQQRCPTEQRRKSLSIHRLSSWAPRARKLRTNREQQAFKQKRGETLLDKYEFRGRRNGTRGKMRPTTRAF